MPKNREWLNRTLVESPYYICLCTSEKAFKKVLKKIDLPVEQHPNFLKDGADAVVYTFMKGDVNIVVVNILPLPRIKKESVYALLVHEAVHVWQHIRDYIGETNPSSEFEAYSIQNISQNLMESYKRQTSEKRIK